MPRTGVVDTVVDSGRWCTTEHHRPQTDQEQIRRRCTRTLTHGFTTDVDGDWAMRSRLLQDGVYTITINFR
jgi:hypothetical protein